MFNVKIKDSDELEKFFRSLIPSDRCECSNAGELFPSPEGFCTFTSDVKEFDDRVEIFLDCPGMTKDDVKVSLRDDFIVVSAERREEKEEKDEEKYVILSERSFGKYERCFPIDCMFDEDKIEASFEDCVLKVVLPKKVVVEPEVEEKTIEIK